MHCKTHNFYMTFFSIAHPSVFTVVTVMFSHFFHCQPRVFFSFRNIYRNSNGNTPKMKWQSSLTDTESCTHTVTLTSFQDHLHFAGWTQKKQ